MRLNIFDRDFAQRHITAENLAGERPRVVSDLGKGHSEKAEGLIAYTISALLT